MYSNDAPKKHLTALVDEAPLPPTPFVTESKFWVSHPPGDASRPTSPGPQEDEPDVAEEGAVVLGDQGAASVEKLKEFYPEGGTKAWLVVFGGFCACFAAFEMTNSIGTFQSYISTHQLDGYSDSAIGWIFGMNTFASLFSGVVVGPLSDAKGPRWLILTGSVGAVLVYVLLGFCTSYWHFMLVIGLLSGISTNLIYVPLTVTVGQYFCVRRGLATGMAFSGGSTSGIVIPLILQALFPEIGFSWTTRVIALLNSMLLAIACVLIQLLRPPTRHQVIAATILPKISLFKNMTFLITSLGILCYDLAMFIPIAYLSSYSIAHGHSIRFSYRLLTFLNVGSCFGRWMPAYAADKVGRFNTMILTLGLCAVSNLVIWLPFGSHTAALIVFSVVFGFSGGSNISLVPVCVGQLCNIEEYGRYYTTATVLASLGSLLGNPIGGTLLHATQGQYWSLIIFTGVCYLIGVLLFIIARGRAGGWNARLRF